MTQPAKSQEPSMEEILASIRRIIADDDAGKSAQPAPEPAKAAARPAASALRAQPEARLPELHAEEPAARAETSGAGLPDQSSDILDLTESMAAPAFGQPDPPPKPAPVSPPEFRKIEGQSDVGFDDAPVEHGDDQQLLSSATSAAVDSAFNALAQTVLVKNARTLEDLVREMLRPMLKSWLDDNLPSMVERLVRAEIERVARGR
jgi:cell pole-organizing protein PopZ